MDIRQRGENVNNRVLSAICLWSPTARDDLLNDIPPMQTTRRQTLKHAQNTATKNTQPGLEMGNLKREFATFAMLVMPPGTSGFMVGCNIFDPISYNFPTSSWSLCDMDISQGHETLNHT